ncbi:glycosyltransferase WbuB [Desulfobacteraceae bacterium SEEP-SAG9]|nr:glycosyltransferase WbuB [Desulfobacteraceae bacterium SEEP-SAG9]
MKKHVLFIVENQAVPQDVRVWNEALFNREMGYDVTVISPINETSKRKYEVIDGIEIYRHPMPIEARGKFSFLFEYLNALFWEFLLSISIFIKKPFQTLHGANPPDHIFLIALFYKLVGVKYIFDHHDLSPENYFVKFKRKDFLYRALLFMEKLTFKTADIVISTNESYKKIAKTRGNKKSNEIFVVRNGPKLSNFTFLPPNDKLKDGFDYLVAYLGVIAEQEGIDNLLRSVHYLVYKRNINNVKFIIIGTGTNWQKMVDLSKKMGLIKYVHFTGFIPYRDLYEILSTADLCVNPEFRNEFTNKSTMIKVMDYMVFGRPIVQYETVEGKITAGGAAKYIPINDEVEFAESIIQLINDPEKRKRMGEIGKKRINEKLNWDLQKTNLKRANMYLENKV